MLLMISRGRLDTFFNRRLCFITLYWNKITGLNNLWLARIALIIGCGLVVRANLIIEMHATGKPYLAMTITIFYTGMCFIRLNQYDKLNNVLERMDDLEVGAFNLQFSQYEFKTINLMLTRRLFWTCLG